MLRWKSTYTCRTLTCPYRKRLNEAALKGECNVLVALDAVTQLGFEVLDLRQKLIK